MEKFDSIVVGAGPAGMSAAYLMAKAGLEVLLIERGDYAGAKNVMGGILYRQPTERVLPDFVKQAPLERPIVEQQLWVLSSDSAMKVGHRNPAWGPEPQAFSVSRAKFDKWFARQCQQAGVLLATETTVDEVIKRGDRIVGVRAGREEGDLYADVVVAADGVNSLLSKQAGLHPEWKPAQVALSVKEVISLPKEEIEARFNIGEDEGATIELVGAATAGMVGTAFIYTNKDCLSVGLGALLADFARERLNPNDVLEQLKAHPAVQPLVRGGVVREYQAHLIPEAGYRQLPPLYAEGMLVVGDAAMLVNGIHREGSNLAMISGKLAAETVIEAKRKGDFSARTLSAYRERLEESFVLKDLKKYAGANQFFESHPHFFQLYPEMANQAASRFLAVDSIPKRRKQKEILGYLRSRRSLWGMARDAFGAFRALR